MREGFSIVMKGSEIKAHVETRACSTGRPMTDLESRLSRTLKDGDTADARARVAKHSSASVEHYTPAGIVDLARSLMGGIDLDPASCAKANEIIKAARYFTEEMDGLAQDWRGSIWLNPPGGRHPDYGTASVMQLIPKSGTLALGSRHAREGLGPS